MDSKADSEGETMVAFSSCILKLDFIPTCHEEASIVQLVMV